MSVVLAWSAEFAQAILADMVTAVTGALIDAEVRLFTNDVEPGPTSVVGDFTSADYTGYADEAVTWSAVTRADDGSYEVLGTVGEFRPSDGATPNSVYGFILLDGEGAFMCGARFEDGPVPMNDALDAISLTPRVRVAPSGLAVVVS